MNKEFELAVLSKLERIADALEGIHEEMKSAREERAVPDYVILHGKKITC